MSPTAAYVMSFTAMAAGLVIMFLMDGLRRAGGVVLTMGGVLGALLITSRPTGAEKSRHVPQD